MSIILICIAFYVLALWMACNRRKALSDDGYRGARGRDDGYTGMFLSEDSRDFLGKYGGSDLQKLSNVSGIDDATLDSLCNSFVIDRCPYTKAGMCDNETVMKDAYKCKMFLVNRGY